MNIWQLQSKLTRRLLVWSGFSILLGTPFVARRDKFGRGLGMQFLAWGSIDALIAILGGRAAQKRLAQLADPQAPEVTARESHNLRRLLLVNAGLDIGYMAAGSILALTKGNKDPGWRGHGIGIFLQGAFLWLFDLYHARQIRATNKTRKTKNPQVP